MSTGSQEMDSDEEMCGIKLRINSADEIENYRHESTVKKYLSHLVLIT